MTPSIYALGGVGGIARSSSYSWYSDAEALREFSPISRTLSHNSAESSSAHRALPSPTNDAHAGTLSDDMKE